MHGDDRVFNFLYTLHECRRAMTSHNMVDVVDNELQGDDNYRSGFDEMYFHNVRIDFINYYRLKKGAMLRLLMQPRQQPAHANTFPQLFALCKSKRQR